MPMRGELTIPAVRLDDRAESDAGAWAIIALCWLVWTWLAFQLLSVDDLGTLYSQPFWG
jgi:hypothetical protein